MQVNIMALLAFTAGVVLLYAGIKDVDPRKVITNALNGKPTESKFGGGGGGTFGPPPGSGGGNGPAASRVNYPRV